MSTLKELMDLGKELGYEGERLADFVKEQQASERDSRQEEREKVKEEKEKLELEIKLAQIKQKRDGSADSSTSLSNDHHSWGAWTTKLIPHFDEEDVGKFSDHLRRLRINWVGIGRLGQFWFSQCSEEGHS